MELKGLNRDLWQQMLRFSLPMIPAQISFWVINASDLFFVREMCGGLDGHSGDAWSGLLSTGYFLPTILTTLVSMLNTRQPMPPRTQDQLPGAAPRSRHRSPGRGF